MPELPEVETVRRGIAPVIEGARIEALRLNRADLRLPFPDRFTERLTGARFLSPGRRAKYLLLPTDRGETLIIHLGMSGRIVIEAQDGQSRPGSFYSETGRHLRHDHVVLDLSGGIRLIYNDPRRFGFMLLEADAALPSLPVFAGMGPEPLGNDFHGQALLDALQGRSAPLKTMLLDQAIVAGLGNIYVCEALHRAGISPFRAGRSLEPVEAERLVPIIRDVLNEALEAGGSTLKDFRHQDGALGYFQHRFRVYDREDAPCPAPGCKGKIERQVQSGRSTFFCASCQA